MKFAILAGAALVLAGSASAQTSSYEPVPPGDGITRQGTDPNGQACTPAGFNPGLMAYPPCPAIGGPASIEQYPRCTREIKDRCIQAYTRWTRE